VDFPVFVVVGGENAPPDCLAGEEVMLEQHAIILQEYEPSNLTLLPPKIY
jgi:hypothetical protein